MHYACTMKREWKCTSPAVPPASPSPLLAWFGSKLSSELLLFCTPWPWRSANAFAARSWSGSDEAVWGLKFGSVCQNPCRCFQYGKSCSSCSGCTVVSSSYKTDNESYSPTKFCKLLPSSISSYHKPAPICLSFSLKEQYSLCNLKTEHISYNMIWIEWKSILCDIIVDRFCVVVGVGNKVCTDIGININREYKCCHFLVELRFCALCHMFASPLILRRIRKQFLTVFRVFFQPVQK